MLGPFSLSKHNLHVTVFFKEITFKSKNSNLLVVENDIRLPDVVEGHPNHGNATKFRAVPDQMRIHPDLGEPAVGSEDLVFLILARKKGREMVLV